MLSHRILEISHWIHHTDFKFCMLCKPFDKKNQISLMRDYLEIKFYKTHFSKNVFFYHPHPLLQKIKGIGKT